MGEMNQSDLDRRLKRLEDREELRDLAARYCTLVDDRDLDQLMLLFSTDGMFGGASGVAARGRDDIRAYYAERLARYGPTFHYLHSQVVEFVGDDEARGLVTAHAEHGIDQRLVIAGLRYHDDYVREAGAWRFRQRLIHFQYFMDVVSMQDQYSAAHRKLVAEPAPADFPESLATWQSFQAEVAAGELSQE